jgi:CheY-like chemotaxis protein
MLFRGGPQPAADTSAQLARITHGALVPMATLPHKRSILVVDDDAASRDTLALLLTRRGHVVETAANGREALNKIEHGIRPNLLILDLSMPVMDGYQLRAELLRRPACAEIPVLVVSGAIGADWARLSPAEALLPKPIDIGKLYAVIERQRDGQEH